MLLPKGRLARLCLSLFCGIASVGLHAQTTGVTPEDEYRKLIRVSEDIHPLGENPFGESVSLYNGALSFDQADVSLTGNGPTIQVERTFHPREKKESEAIDGAFSDWDLEIPRITTVTANQQNVTGWQVGNSSDSNARCSHFGAPPTVMAQQGGSDWEPHSWWAGYQLVVPGQGSQDLLGRVSGNAESPQMSGLSFPIVTKDHWMVSCLASTDGSAPGEAFMAVAPNGTKYWFSHMVYRWAATIHRPIGSDPLGLGLPRLHADPRLMVASNGDILPQALNQLMAAMPALAPDDYLRRRTASLLVTKIQDRFGNTLTYSYSGDNLTKITASDGREVGFGYEAGTNRVISVKVQPTSGNPRTWSYQYNSDPGHTLAGVVLPDGSAWSYQLGNFLYGQIETTQGNCDGNALLSDTVQTGSITHPSGLVGTFQIKPIIRGRSYVLKQCVKSADDPIGYALVPRTYTQYSIISKTFTGAGTPVRTWQYGYSSSNESWTSDCTSGCVSTVWTDVTDPGGAAIRYTFSNRFDVTEGQLLRTDYYSAAAGSSLLRSVVNTYAAANAGPWPARYGNNLQERMNAAVLEQEAPLSKRVTTQESTSYTWLAEAFNSYAQVTKAKRYSSIAGRSTIEEQTSYCNDAARWVLGLPVQVDNLSSGDTVDKYVYLSGTCTLSERWHFGQKVMSYVFYPDTAGVQDKGQLKSFTDGNGNTTTLSSYMRGIPQAISYPDGTDQSLLVDDLGQIQSITDQAGATTSYDYDEVGRLTRIGYPAGDEQAWYPKTFSYAFVASAERGVGANHWRRTVAKGNQRQVTYFNAMLQPVLTDTYIYGDAGSHINLRSDYNYRGQTKFASYPIDGTPDLADISAGTTSTFDVLGRLTKTQETAQGTLLTTLIEYQSGARKQVTDPRGKVTTTTYQVFDEPSYDVPIKVEAPTGLTQTIARDQYGNPLWINQAGPYGTGTVSLTKTLTYDSYHRLCRATEPESGSEVMAYDAANNLAWSAAGLNLTVSDCGLDQVADAGKTKRTYDEMNRLRTLTPPADTQATTYDYDALGNLKSAISGISTWSATRNKLGQLTGETLQLTGQDAWYIGYAHDAYGSLKTLTYPDGAIVGYAPDALGRATQVGSYASGVSYFPNGEVQSFTFGNGTLYSAEQNIRQHLVNFSYGHGTTLDISEDLAYDTDGNILKFTDLVDGHRTKSFGYDDLNRLTVATAANLWGTESYTYDPLNNIRSRTSNGSAVFTYNYVNNRLESITGAGSSSFVYDNRGNVVGKNGSTLQFDQKNQLTQIDGLASYAYDAAGRRVLKSPVGGNPTYYFYNQAGQLLFQWAPIDTTLGAVTDFVYLGRKLIARQERTESTVAPAAVASVTAAANGSVVNVSWAGSANTDTYQLQQSRDGGAWAAVYSGAALSHAVSETVAGSYVFRVAACAMAGCSAFVTSSPVTVAAPATSAVSAPASNASGAYTVTWGAVAGATSYTLQEQVNGGAWATVYTGGAASTAISGKANGTYGYRVQACNGVGCSAWSATDSTVVTHPPATPTVSAPTGSSTGSYTVSWGAVSTATSYNLQEQVNGGAWTTIYSGAGTSKAISGKTDATYGYHVRACNVGGCSAWSATDATKVALIPVTPAAPHASYTGYNWKPTVTVTWSAVAHATSYQLEQSDPSGGDPVYNGSATSWTQFVVASGEVKYRVKACNSNGCSAFSAYSNSLLLDSGAGF